MTLELSDSTWWMQKSSVVGLLVVTIDNFSQFLFQLDKNVLR